MKSHSIEDIGIYKETKGCLEMEKNPVCADPDPVSILENADIGLLQLDRNYCIIYVNPTAAADTVL